MDIVKYLLTIAGGAVLLLMAVVGALLMTRMQRDRRDKRDEP